MKKLIVLVGLVTIIACDNQDKNQDVTILQKEDLSGEWSTGCFRTIAFGKELFLNRNIEFKGENATITDEYYTEGNNNQDCTEQFLEVTAKGSYRVSESGRPLVSIFDVEYKSIKMLPQSSESTSFLVERALCSNSDWEQGHATQINLDDCPYVLFSGHDINALGFNSDKNQLFFANIGEENAPVNLYGFSVKKSDKN